MITTPRNGCFAAIHRSFALHTCLSLCNICMRCRRLGQRWLHVVVEALQGEQTQTCASLFFLLLCVCFTFRSNEILLLCFQHQDLQCPCYASLVSLVHLFCHLQTMPPFIIFPLCNVCSGRTALETGRYFLEYFIYLFAVHLNEIFTPIIIINITFPFLQHSLEYLPSLP